MAENSTAPRRRPYRVEIPTNWYSIANRSLLLLVAIILGAISVQLFMVPVDIAPTGVTGIAVLLKELIGTPIGFMTLVLNVPILLLGYRYLGGMQTVIMTTIAAVGYGLALDIIGPLLPPDGLTDERLLNAIFAGITLGISTGLVMRAGGTYGGTSTIATIVRRRTGIPMSTTFLYTDMSVVLLAGLVFDWESALFAVVTLFISGVALDYVLEGPAVIRVVFIVTTSPREVSDVLMYHLQRGVTALEGKGMYSDTGRTMLFVTIARTEVGLLRDLVATVDEQAFVVVGQGHTAYGSGFKRKLSNGGQNSMT